LTDQKLSQMHGFLWRTLAREYPKYCSIRKSVYCDVVVF